MSRKRKEATALDTSVENSEEFANNGTFPTGEVLHDAAVDGLPMAMPAEAANDVGGEQEQDPRTPIPDPFSQHIVNLTADSNGPKIRLQRSNRYRQMRIVADEKPAAKYLQAFREAGMKWRNEDKAWTIQLEKDAAWRTALDIERVFLDVANGIRQDNGLPEIQPLGR